MWKCIDHIAFIVVGIAATVFLVASPALATPTIRLDVQESPVPSPGTITGSYYGSADTVYVFLVVTEMPGNVVTAVSYGFDFESDGSVINEGFTLSPDWQVSGGNYGFQFPGQGSVGACPAVIGHWTLRLAAGSQSFATLAITPPGGMDGEAILVSDADHRGRAVAQTYHAGINEPAPSPTIQVQVDGNLRKLPYHVLCMTRGRSLVLPTGLIGAPLESVTNIDSTLSVLLEDHGPMRIDRVFPHVLSTDSVRMSGAGYPIPRPALWNVVKFTLADSSGVEELIEELNASPSVTYAERNSSFAPMVVPNDSLFGESWHLQNPGDGNCEDGVDVDAPEAWDVTTGSADVMVGVVDSGIWRDHEDLSSRTILGDSTFAPGSHIEHGTLVTGVLAATANNDIGCTGMDWHCTIFGAAVDSMWSEESVADGINRATAAGAKVINLSLADTLPVETVRRACHDAFISGTTIVAAMGNTFHPPVRWPAKYTEIITAVGQIDCQNGCQDLKGPWMDVTAPGVGVWTTNYPNQGYPTMYVATSGTSLATPVVSGTVSLLLSQRPTLRDVAVEYILHTTATDNVAGCAGLVNTRRVVTFCDSNLVRENRAVFVDSNTVASSVRTLHWTYPPRGFPSGLYRVREHELHAENVQFNLGLVEPPIILVHKGGTTGLFGGANSDSLFYDYGWATAYDVTEDEASFRTYVYEVLDENDQAVAWWPVHRDSVRIEYSLVGGDLPGTGDVALESRAELQMSVNTQPWTTTGAREIRLTAPMKGQCVLKVFDASGAEVRTVHNGQVVAGENRFLWSGDNNLGRRVGSGVYFIRAESAGTRKSLKVVLVR